LYEVGLTCRQDGKRGESAFSCLPPWRFGF
jgi:hypothetical protein